MADNEATIKFILQDEGGGGNGAPSDGGAGVGGGSGTSGPTRPATTAGRQKAAEEKADVVIAERAPAIAKKEKGEKANRESGAKAQDTSTEELSNKRSGVGPGAVSGIAGVAQAARIPGAGVAGGIVSAAGPAAAAAAVVAGGVVAITKAEDLISKRAGGRAGLLSGEVAAANARARIRELEADIRTADVLGGTLARNVEASSRLETQARRLSENVVKPGLDKFAKAKSLAAKALEFTADLSETEAGKTAINFGTHFAARGIGGLPGLALSLYLDTLADEKIKGQRSYAWRLSQQQHLGLDDKFGETIREGGTTRDNVFPGANAGRPVHLGL